MSSKKVTETYVNSFWGKIARLLCETYAETQDYQNNYIIAWGNPKNPPILMLHGYLDTAATFTFLVEKLPDKYYYVGVDIPGHGKSDSLPHGLLITKIHAVEVIRIVAEHMKWKTFTFLSHSMSCVMGILYNTFYPGNIEKMIFLDPKPALGWYHVIHHHAPLWYNIIYGKYYENYEKMNFDKPKSQTHESWINSIARTRNLTKEQSEVVLSRSFIPTGNDTYQLSWENRVKLLAHVAIPIKTLYSIMTKLPPTLVLNASDYRDYIGIEGAKEYAENLLQSCEENVSHFYTTTIKGGHDFHITNPERIVDQIEIFLISDGKYYLKKSRL